MTDWRLIISPPLSASSNMAIDEAILNVASQPTLRFYRWNAPSISIGRFQHLDDDFLKTCSRSGVPVVRRPTGGRAILHHLEITYSVVSSYDLFPGSTALTGIYKTLARWQVESLNSLDVKALMGSSRGYEKAYQKSKSCFMTSTPYEIHAGGKKISGSAQRRCKTSFLQHGSILIHVDREFMQKIMGSESLDPDSFTTLRREGYEGSIDEAVEIMARQFSLAIECTLSRGTLSGEETMEVDRLLNERYADLALSSRH